MKLGEAYVEIYADQTKLTAGLNKAQKNVGASMKAIGRSMAIAGGIIVAGFGMAIKTAAKFEKSMALTASVASATSEELKELSDYARKMGEQSVFSASQAADGMYYLASAGMKVNEIMGALEGTLALAAATQADLAFTSESVAAAISQFALDATEATRVANVYAAAISSSQARMDKLATSMSIVGPMAHSMGMSIEETTGILMGLYNAGIDASTAGTSLRMAFVKLLGPVGKGADALDRLKVSVVDSSGEMRPFKDIIDDLGIAGMTTADAMDIFGMRAGPAMMALISQGTGAIQENVDTITDTEKAYEMAAMQIDTFEGAMKLLRSAFEELQITLVQDLMPTLKGFIEWVTEGVKKISDWMKENPKLTATLVKITAAMGALMLLLGPLLMVLPGLVKGFATLKVGIAAIGVVGSGPIGWLILAVSAVYLAFKNWDKIVEIVDKIKNAVIGKIREWSASLNKWWDNIVATTDNKWILVADKIIKAIGDVYKWLVDNIGKWIESIAGWWGDIKKDTESVWNEIASIIIDSAKAWMNFFAETLPGWILWVIGLFDRLTGRFDEFQDRINKMTLAPLNAEIEATTELLKGMKRGISELKPGIELDELKKALEAEKKKLEELKERRVELIYFMRTGIGLTYEEIQARKEVTEEIKEEQEAVKALIEGQKEEIEGVGELLKSSEELSSQMKILTAEYELTNKTIEDTAKYYQDMLDVAEELVEVKEAEMDALEEGTTKWDEAYLAYLAAQKVVKDLTEEIVELNEAQKEITVSTGTMAQATGEAYNKWYELAKLWAVRPDLQTYFKMSAKELAEFSKEIEEVTVAEETMAEATGEVYNKWYELAKLWAVRPDLQAYFDEAAKAAKELGDATEDAGEKGEKALTALQSAIQSVVTGILEGQSGLEIFGNVLSGIGGIVGGWAGFVIGIFGQIISAIAQANKKVAELKEEMEELTAAGFVVPEEAIPSVTLWWTTNVEEAKAWVEKFKEMLKEVQLAMGGALQAALYATTASEAWKIFKSSLYDAIYEYAFNALIKAFVSSAAYQSIIAPFYQQLEEAIEDSFVDGVFDADLFNATATPIIAGIQAGIAELQPAIEAMWSMWQQIQATKPPAYIPPTTEATGGGVEYASGGLLKGFQRGRGTDTVPAMLTPGEYVISKPMVDFIKRTGAVTSDLVSAIGSGARTPIPAFAGGGRINNPISNTYDQRSYSNPINIQPGAIQIVTPKFSGADAKNMFRLIEKEASHRGLAFGRV